MKVIISSGGTAGHIFPAILTAEAFRQAGHTVVFCGVFKKYRERIETAGFPVHELSAVGLSFQNLSAIVTSFRAMSLSFFQAWQTLRREKPDAVLGFGAYGAFAVVLAALLQGIPTLIHEQNVRPGKANKLLSLFVKRIAVSFSESLPYFSSNRTVVTGYPCREIRLDLSREKSAETFGLTTGKFTILVIGGSQGSHQINTIFWEALTSLARQLNVQVIHACGLEDYAPLQSRYHQSGVPFYLTPFLNDMAEAYFLADLVVARAGAGTVTELAAFGIPAILIPYPHAGGHQAENAMVLVKRDAAVILKEENLNAVTLAREIRAMFPRKNRNEKLRQDLATVYHPDAAKRLVQETMHMVQK